MRRAARTVGLTLVVGGAALLAWTSRGGDDGPTAGPPVATPGIECGWDPVTGRGEVRITRSDGARALVRIEDRFAGYTGGLVLGSQDRAAYALERPGEEPVGLWCAQDESILVHGAAGAAPLELDHGWSENVGGPVDGAPLRYAGGAVLAQDAGGLLLAARSAARGLVVDRWLLVLQDGTLLVRARLGVEGPPVTVDWWTGDDPWVGRYGDSRGDCGWTSDGLLRTEAALDPDRIGSLGIADAPDVARPPALANAFVVGPRCPRPDRMLLADGFAHDPAEVAAHRPLGRGPGSVAFNVGWVDRQVAAGAPLELTYALGVADTSAAIPAAPAVPDAAWRRLEAAAPAPAAPPSGLSFAWERVTLEVAPAGDAVTVRGTYGLAPPAGVHVEQSIFFPFAVDAAHPTPDGVQVTVDTPAGPRALAFDRLRDGVVFTVEAPGAEVVVHVEYRQATSDGAATYILTSARTWPDPIGRATLEVHLPPGLSLVESSLPLGAPAADAAGARWTLERATFRPDRDLTVRWR